MEIEVQVLIVVCFILLVAFVISFFVWYLLNERKQQREELIPDEKEGAYKHSNEEDEN